MKPQKRVQFRREGRLGPVLMTMELAARLCCGVLTASGLIEARRAGTLGQLSARVSASTSCGGRGQPSAPRGARLP
ncbi:hypothetical protein [Saccharopolyspora taberi]|uniref:hypothetical protein n=1 Tax=Saccharopolyspora taberi TaxID=60895 RepID=UPI0031E1CA81